ncbi:hypothetical protein V8C35DRAFT_326329 [Trichoderma chlorosporum]
MIFTSSRRLTLFIVALVSLFLAIAFYYHSYPDPEGLIAMIPYSSRFSNTSISTSLESTSSHSSQSQNSASHSKLKTSRLHYLIPASQPNLNFCYNLVSSAVNRYPVPTLLGWHGVGEFDAATTHLAKLRSMQRYLDSLPPEEDDDLAIIVDGYDVLIQLPPAIMVERYFQLADRADAHLAKRFGVSVRELHKRGLRQTIFMGPDKICWPIDPRAPRTIMGPIGDLRKYITATMDEITATHDSAYEFRESDQYYLSNVWGRQEYFRSKMMKGKIPAGPSDKIIPAKSSLFQKTEYHVAIEYESGLFQTRAGYEPYFGYLQFNQSGLTARLDADILQVGSAFELPAIKMPENVADSLSRLYDAIPEAHPGTTSANWLSIVQLGVNFITHHIYGLWHCTGPKEFVELEYPNLWFYPFAKSLLKAAVKASQAGEPLTQKLIDGRRWVPKKYYPAAHAMSDEFGGAWSDLDDEFVPWRDLCQPHNELLFQGEEKGSGLHPE